MTTQTTPSPDAPARITTDCPQSLNLEWKAGATRPFTIGEYIACTPGGHPELFQKILGCLVTFIALGPGRENFYQWRSMFGDPSVFVPVTEITLSPGTLPHQSDLLRLWNEEEVIAEVTSFHPDELRRLISALQQRVGEFGYSIDSQAWGSRGLLYKVSS